MRHHVLVAGMAGLAFACFVSAQSVPTTVSFQGRLDESGTPTTGTVYMQFEIWSLADGGSRLWREPNANGVGLPVEVANGLFTHLLGSNTALPATVFTASASRYLQVIVNPGAAGEQTLAPRLRLTTAPYADMAERAATATNALSLGGVAAASYLTLSGNGSGLTALNASALASGTVLDALLSPNVALLGRTPQTFTGENRFLGSATVQAPLRARSTFFNETASAETEVFKVDRNGGFVATGFVRDVGNTAGCAPQIPATGSGTRFMWFPCRGSVRFGRVPTAQANWDDANMDDFTFAGGNQVTASGYGAFSYGDQVNVSSTVGVGFGSAVTVSGTAGFSAGASNLCSGFACTAIGYFNHAGGQGSVAIGYRAAAPADYGVAIGHRATTIPACNNVPAGTAGCGGAPYGAGSTGAFTIADESTMSYVGSLANNQFTARFAGGFRLRTSATTLAPGVGGSTGCDLPAGSGTWSCSSSREIKAGFTPVAGADLLARLASLPIERWSYIGDDTRAPHLGPTAEDFYTAFGLGGSDKAIGAQDLSGVALVAAQELERRSAAQAARIEALEAEVRELRTLLASLAPAPPR